MSKKSLSAVKAKSEELKIPYENLLSAFVIEEAVTAFCGSDEAENFRLKNNSILSLEYYRRKAPTRLEYVVLSEEELTVRNVIHRMSKIFQNEKKAELWWKYRVEKEDEGICVYLSAKIEELQIPVQLVLEQEKEEPSEPSREELHPFLEEERSVEYLHYPMEGILAEHFIRIMRDMELINDMGSYYILYELLSKEMNSSRKVTEQIESLAKEQRIPLKKERFEMFEGYQNSSYMKKKWKSYLKKEKKKTPSFEEVMKVMIAYYRPIWDSLAEGNYYLGDWMPELMRYLD
ncbi:hypothetical protein WMO43_09910 [Lachnospiraceae bacterium CLA-AA-H185]|uniref:Uncharacterized protein n=1 Tax=Maccoyibacter intestinihominis TaxID=3133499 RepID=A0ABV1HFQ2_9FIRM